MATLITIEIVIRRKHLWEGDVTEEQVRAQPLSLIVQNARGVVSTDIVSESVVGVEQVEM